MTASMSAPRAIDAAAVRARAAGTPLLVFLDVDGTLAPIAPHPDAAHVPAARARTAAGTPLLVFLDVDGTLAPIAPHPDAAHVPAATRDAVRALVGLPDVHVALVSGRLSADALGMVGLDGIWASGNHGAELVPPGGELQVDPDVVRYVAELAQARAELESELAALPGVLVEDKRLSLSVHTRLAGRSAVPAVRAAVERAAERHGLHVATGKEVLELRAPVTVDKGTATWALAERLGGVVPGASLFYAGDDVTDEDAFRVLRERAPHALTVRVGAREAPTFAEFVVPDTDAVRRLLVQLADWRG